MNAETLRWLLAAHAVVTLFMTGLIWFVQVVHYPLLGRGYAVCKFSACAMLHIPYANRVHTLLICFSAVSFLGFGIACFYWQPMKREYVRYGVPHFRRLIGSLQMAGGFGLLAGFAVPLIGQFAATGLAILMLAGVILRIRIKDSLIQTLPAVFYLVLNAYLAAAGFQ